MSVFATECLPRNRPSSSELPPPVYLISFAPSYSPNSRLTQPVTKLLADGVDSDASQFEGCQTARVETEQRGPSSHPLASHPSTPFRSTKNPTLEPHLSVLTPRARTTHSVHSSMAHAVHSSISLFAGHEPLDSAAPCGRHPRLSRAIEALHVSSRHRDHLCVETTLSSV